jgi:hypothetical protein
MPREDYALRQAMRQSRLEKRAERLTKESQAAFKSTDRIASGIPMGQPILVGHHSEGRHRRDLARIDAGMRKGCELAKAAGEAASDAAAVGTGGISSDDPTAIAQLREKLAKCEAFQTEAKRLNALVRAARKAHGDDRDAVAQFLIGKGVGATRARTLATPDFCGRWGIPDYETKNNGAEIRRIKERIADLERLAKVEAAEFKIGDITLARNTEENRIQLIFPGRPAPEIIAELKRSGWRWSPSQKAWQRMISNAAEYDGRRIAEKANSLAPTE